MLEGWYCRTLASQRASGQQEDQNVNVDDDSGSDDQAPHRAPSANENNTNTNGDQVDYKAQYRYLKRKLKFLIYENEFFQDSLRSNQRRLLKVSRDRAFLLDRLLQYEKPDETSESDVTESSEDEATKEAKKRKPESSAGGNNASTSGSARGRKRKAPMGDGPQQKTVIVEKNSTEAHTTVQHNNQPPQQQNQAQLPNQQQHEQQTQQTHLTSYADVERHLRQASRPNVMELMPEHASATVPTEMFSNEPSLDGEPHEQLMHSPTHVAAEECVTMEYAN